MTISLVKAAAPARERVNVMRGGHVVTRIAGMPAWRVRGALIRLTGTEAAWVAIQPHRDHARKVLVTVGYRCGRLHLAEHWGSVDLVRRDWIRYALANGVFAGIARMR